MTAAVQRHRELDYTSMALKRIKTTTDLLRWLYRYVEFNGIFAGGVSNLAGELHIRQRLFRDAEATWSIFADRSANIAARIFFAAEDEYANERKISGRVIHHHRFLAQHFLRSLAEYWGISPQTFERGYAYEYAPLQQALQAVRRGYCIDQTNDECSLLRGIGFHIGSEHLADGEFTTIDHFLQSNYPDIVVHLRRTGKPNAYTWLAVHTIVEAEHAEHAFAAADEAVHYYNGAHSREQARQWILEGIDEFARVQKAFFEHILES